MIARMLSVAGLSSASPQGVRANTRGSSDVSRFEWVQDLAKDAAMRCDLSSGASCMYRKTVEEPHLPISCMTTTSMPDLAIACAPDTLSECPPNLSIRSSSIDGPKISVTAPLIN